MAKQQPKKKHAAAKNIHSAALIKKDANKYLVFLLLSVLGGVIIWAVYTFIFHDMLPNQMVDSLIVFIMAVCLVFLIGEVGNKYARLLAEYRKAKEQWGVTDEEVKEHLSKM